VQGAQVFYNQGEGARELAKCVQQALNKTVNAPHGKTARPIAPTIYLMKHVTGPAVLLECGFLSNAEETARLKTPDYQIKLAAVIAGGLLSVSAGAEGEGP
jgi:N-acetylmuramoyl-L-alanine amidase